MTCNNGDMTYLWHDVWWGDRALKDSFPHIYTYASNKYCTVREALMNSPSSNTIQIDFITWIPDNMLEELARCREALQSFSRSDEGDRPWWRGKGDGAFSTKSFYGLLEENGTEDKTAKSIWRVCCPLKVKIHCILATSKCLLTAEKISRITGAGFLCPLCQNGNETPDHLFVSCSFTRDVMRDTKNILQIKHWPVSMNSMWKSWRERRVRHRDWKYWDSFVMATMWLIWQERNDRIFKNKHSTVQDVAQRIQRSLALWRTWFGNSTSPRPPLPSADILGSFRPP